MNKITQMVKRLNAGILIWIDENYNNPENSFYLKLMSENKNLIFKYFHNVDDAFNFIFKKNEYEDEIRFRAIFILISGRLYPEYQQKLKERINKVIFSIALKDLKIIQCFIKKCQIIFLLKK